MQEEKEKQVEREVFLIPAYEYDPTVHNIEYRYLPPNTFPARTGEESTGTDNAPQDWQSYELSYDRRRRPFYPYYGGYGYHPYYGGFHPYYGGYHPWGYHPFGYHQGWGYGYHHESSPSR